MMVVSREMPIMWTRGYQIGLVMSLPGLLPLMIIDYRTILTRRLSCINCCLIFILILIVVDCEVGDCGWQAGSWR